MAKQSNEYPIEYRPLQELKLWSENYRQGDVGAIMASILQFGFVDPVAVWQGGIVFAGNHRLKALHQIKAAGLPAPRGLKVKRHEQGAPTWYVPTVDISDLTETEARAFAIADNRTAERAANDPERLAHLLTLVGQEDVELLEATGYDGDDLDGLLSLLANAGGSGDNQEAVDPPVDAAEEAFEKWQTAPGQLWVIPTKHPDGADHYLYCGDCRDPAALANLLGYSNPSDPAQIDLLLTDPPYGMSVVKVKSRHRKQDVAQQRGHLRPPIPYAFGGVGNNPKKPTDPGWRGASGDGGLVTSTDYRPVYGDDEPFDPGHLIGIATNMILWGGNFFASHLPDSRCWLVWYKHMTGDFADAELAYTDFDKPIKLYEYTWNGLVREGPRALEGIKRVHPTQKPVGLMMQILEDFSEPGAAVADLYLGSGTMLLACEQTGRQGYGMEIDPHYVALSLERLSQLGLEPELLAEVSHDTKQSD